MKKLSKLLPLIIILSLILIPQNLRTNELVNSNNETEIQECNQHTILQFESKEIDSTQRQLIAMSFKECSSNPLITRALEQAIQQDDYLVRKQAWLALGSHLDTLSKNFLISSYFKKKILASETLLLYQYLQQLVIPKDQSKTIRIWERGLLHSDHNIRFASWIGLAKVDSQKALPTLNKILLNNNDKTTMLAALQAISFIRQQGTFRLISKYLDHTDPEIQKVAIRITATIPEKLATESLLKLNITGPHPANQAYLYNIIQPIIKENKKYSIGWTKEKTNLFSKPTQHSKRVATIEKNEILYLSKPTYKLYYFKNDTDQKIEKSKQGTYYFSQTSSGLQGWIHNSKIVRTALN